MQIISDVQGLNKRDNQFGVKELAAVIIDRNERGYEGACCSLQTPL